MVYGNEFRKEFLEKNPDKKITIEGQYCTGVGTTKYWCEWTGEWEEKDLVDFCDGGSYNFGGRIDGKRKLENGNYKGIVCVYYD